ncbi:MAG: DUF4159 domain-containing protein [Candidatus Poribacteria bacterium]|nr:DUF4159 domain-containing protein [Candidatus Poribacteria bacterium]MDE0506247.1 DUF4159 domain-containing protein [Candidatus Poribacteria bacterium]
MQRLQSHRITLASWLLSLLLNVLILYLFTLFPQRQPETLDDALEVETVIVPTERTANARVTPLSRSNRPSQLVKLTPLKQRSTPTPTLPLVTHARPAEEVSQQPMLTSPDEAMPIESGPIATALHARFSPSMPGATVGSDVEYGRQRGLSVGAPARKVSRLDKLRGEVGASPQAEVRGSGREISGYYHIAIVQHEDAAETVRTKVLERLADAVNRWTNVHTKLLPGDTPLADPAILRIPLVYITATSAFAFSEQERANLNTYLQNGGTLLFSDLSENWGRDGAVANSIRFELWKILGESAESHPLAPEEPVCNSFFEFKKGAPLVDKSRGGFFTLQLDERIAVFYDAAGLGLKWLENDSDEKWLRWGVNLIVYTLTNWR